jgi:hypothetical protein
MWLVCAIQLSCSTFIANADTRVHRYVVPLSRHLITVVASDSEKGQYRMIVAPCVRASRVDFKGHKVLDGGECTYHES